MSELTPTLWDKLVKVVVPTNPEEFWAFVAALIGIAVLVVALKGLNSVRLAAKSLELTRTDMLNRAKRDARQAALDRAKEWANEIIPLNGKILQKISDHKVPVFAARIEDVQFDPDPVARQGPAGQWCASLPDGLFGECLVLMNKVEAWSMHFTTGMADAEACFGPIAPTFCQRVVQNYAIYIVKRTDAGSGAYPHTVTLFKQWLHELDAKKRGDLAGELVARLRDLQKGGPANPQLLPPPLGTDLDR